MTDPPTSKTHDTGQKSAPLPSESSPLTFTCRCLNLRVNGRIAKDDEKQLAQGKASNVKVYLPVSAEVLRLSGYVTYDQDAFREANDDAVQDGEDTLGPSWRICWLCNVRCYETQGKARNDGAAEEEWVEVDLASGIVYGDELDNTDEDLLPFSKLRLDAPDSRSNFGQPPNNHSTPTPYPAPSHASDPNHLIPPPHDPFFLPPPFIPNNPHLRVLCDNAGDYLKSEHKKLEDEVKRYISSKTQEMRILEEKVRGEVEMLWLKYKDGPGQSDTVERARSSSTSRSDSFSRPISKDRSASLSKPNDNNPLAKVAASPSANPPSTSLLAQSLSANTFYASPPTNTATVKDEINKTLNHVASTYDKRDDSRAVAMSYVFSSLADNMGGSSTNGTSQSRRRSSSKSNGEPLPDKDSWIEEERATLRSTASAMSAVDEEEIDGSTPRPSGAKQLRKEKKAEKGKGKGKVKFEEPEEETKDTDVEDTVFDMEMDDHRPIQPHESTSSPPDKLDQLPISRTRNIVEASLSRTFAADAPSHRAAWRRIEENGSMYATLRRASSSSDEEGEVEDESRISKLAMSMPMAIHLPKAKAKYGNLTELERKTSLSDKHGILVPPLLKAMRQRGVSEENSLGLGVPSDRGRTPSNEINRKTSRSASVSREREQMQSYRNDPGALYESLGDECDEDDDGENGVNNGTDEEDQGTLRGNKGFIPPHVLARKSDKEELPGVGWRSMVSS